jgi:hypothetical protein
MKKSDHNVETLTRHLRDEANSLRERAKKLDALTTHMTKSVVSKDYSPHTFEFIAQEAIDITTHRSNVHLPGIARTAAALAAEAAVEWADAKAKEVAR